MTQQDRDEILTRHALTTQPEWLKGLKQQALERFDSLGYPSLHQESWKYTNPKIFIEGRFQSTSSQASSAQWNNTLAQKFQKPSLAKNRLTFLNGYLVETQLSEAVLQSKVFIASVRDVLEKNPERLQKYLTEDFDALKQPFLALNKAYLQDGAFIELPAGLVLEEPIELRFVSSPEAVHLVSYPHNLIVAGANSQITILENYEGSEAAHTYWTNASTQIIAAENAVVSHYRLQRESAWGLHLNALKILQDRQSQVDAYSFSLGAQLARFEIDAAFQDEGASCSLNGLYFAQDSQHVDHQTLIDHRKPHCTSQELFKGILDDRAQGVFNGSIVVRPGAQKTYSNLVNRNLLLSKEAMVNTKPLLEIFANDVKCSHGATIGRLDENQVFYLRSRGIPQALARALLTYAFASEVFGQIKVASLKSRLEDFLLHRLHIDAIRQEVPA